MQTLSQLQAGKLAGSNRLKLSENLQTFPLEIITLADTLEVLDLSDNALSSLPEELTQLTQLRIIFASHNNFDHLPEVLGKLPKLEMIGFKSNHITTVAENALPTKLRWLILTDNKIQQLPNSLGERPRLQKLALAGNQLSELPQSLSQAKNLELVRISANNITKCPDQLLGLPKLAWFAFAGNPFSTVAVSTETSVANDVQENIVNSVPTISSSDYTLAEVLGQGASGVISRAHWNTPKTKFPTDIAVKVFKGEVTSDGYPQDELQSCLQVGYHANLVQSLAQVSEPNHLALVMGLIPSHYQNLGLPPSFASCTRDTFPNDFTLSIKQISHIVSQMTAVFNHLHLKQVCHGDLYAHNTLFDKAGNIIFGDFGAATRYQMLTPAQQAKVKQIEQRALGHFIDDLLTVCIEEDKEDEAFSDLTAQVLEYS